MLRRLNRLVPPRRGFNPDAPELRGLYEFLEFATPGELKEFENVFRKIGQMEVEQELSLEQVAERDPLLIERAGLVMKAISDRRASGIMPPGWRNCRNEQR
jgi:hypothetical protein